MLRPVGSLGDGSYVMALLCPLKRRLEIREASEEAGNGNPLKGQSIQVRGTKPPCYNCHRAMQAFAEQNQMESIDYVFEERPHGGDSAIRYSSTQQPQFGGYGSGTDPSTFSTSHGGEDVHYMGGGYRLNPESSTIEPGARRDVNREANPGDYKFFSPSQNPSGRGVRETYETLNDRYQ